MSGAQTTNVGFLRLLALTNWSASILTCSKVLLVSASVLLVVNQYRGRRIR